MTGGRYVLLYAVVAAAMYGSLVASASRTGFVLASAELVVIPLLAWRRNASGERRAAWLLATVLGLTVLFAWAAGWDVLWERLRRPDPNDVRREFLQSSLDMIRARPGLGLGLGTWSTAYPAYAYFDSGKFANQAHNDWAQWACEGGLPFAVLMLWVAVWSARAALRTLWGAGVVSVFLHCLADYPIQRPGLSACFFLFLGLMASSRNPKNSLKKTCQKATKKALDVL
jgi:O-antigen ligase